MDLLLVHRIIGCLARKAEVLQTCKLDPHRPVRMARDLLVGDELVQAWRKGARGSAEPDARVRCC